MWVVYDATQAAVRALRLGAELSEANATPLAVVLLAENNDAIGSLKEDVQGILGRAPPSALLPTSPEALDKLRRTLVESGCSMLLLPRERVRLIAEPASGLLEALECPLVVVS